MKRLLAILCSTFSLISFEEESDSIVCIYGTIQSPDSIPVENAYLISYKTMRAYATDKNGTFGILLNADDSLKINHISFEPIVIKPSTQNGSIELFMKYAENVIGDVNIINPQRNLERMKKNMTNIMNELEDVHYFNYQDNLVYNSYAPCSDQTSYWDNSN